MNYGLYIAASGASTQLARQEVFTNNLANVNTTGFKSHVMAVKERETAQVEKNLNPANTNRMLERLGGGVMPAPVRLTTKQGALDKTGRQLDAAINGKGYFVVQTGSNDADLRLTRDGRFAVGPDGSLVLSGNGTPVQDAGGGSIKVNPNQPIEIQGDGTVLQAGAQVGRLMIADVGEPEKLRTEGNGLLGMADGSALSLQDASGRVVQGAVENASVEPINELMGATNAAREVENNLRMISMISENMQMAISRFGRVS